MADEAQLPPLPQQLAEIRIGVGSASRAVVLHGLRVWHDCDLPSGVEAHMDPISTGLVPTVVPGAGSVMWLLGWWLGELDCLGDTVVTCSLLLHISPTAPAGTVRALWYEDHQEVPRRFWIGAGSIEAGGTRGVVHLDIDLAEAAFGDHLKLVGTLRSR